MAQSRNAREVRRAERVALYRSGNPAAERWAAGYGVIRHSLETQARVISMAETLEARGITGEGEAIFDILHATDRIASAGMWLVVHQTYARNVWLDGRDLTADDFKPQPEGHTGGSLNMVPAYAGYMAANAITGHTRSWLMGQGHCVSAIDALNLILGNMTPAHAERYDVSDEGLTRYVRDFYSYRLRQDGRQDSPVGSHVNAHTAGGMSEGGYLGVIELLHMHMPLAGERLVVFLSDGAFEEQRGSDWAPRWWRGEDSGLIVPIMINNGRRIDQRTTMRQQGGPEWFIRHLELNNFDPVVLDGRDPAAFAWAILEMEWRLEAAAQAIKSHGDRYPVPLPHGVALAPKGAGFYNEGKNLAHNLPLEANPAEDPDSAATFNEFARGLWVASDDLRAALRPLSRHTETGRPRERDHALAHREVRLRESPEPDYRRVDTERRADPDAWTADSPMKAIDSMFLATVRANPHLRPRVGNPDEMRSNRMVETLEQLKFRVTSPEEEVPESLDGAVITALNEEAVAAAALGNQGGINIIVTYEAFAAKMHGVVRQHITFARQCSEAGRPQRWLSVPLVLTSHTWENGKNEHSHQDPVMAEAMLGELSDVSRVLFAADYNSAAAVMKAVYRSQGQVWTIVAPKSSGIPDLFTAAEAERVVADGAARLDWAGHDVANQRLVLTAVGAYQLVEALRASERLAERGVAHSVVYMLEPGRFRTPRTDGEQAHSAPDGFRTDLYPDGATACLFVSHTRPEAMIGVLHELIGGRRAAGLGFINHGGTLDVNGMLFVNRCTWAHVLAASARLLRIDETELLSDREADAINGKASPHGVII